MSINAAASCHKVNHNPEMERIEKKLTTEHEYDADTGDIVERSANKVQKNDKNDESNISSQTNLTKDEVCAGLIHQLETIENAKEKSEFVERIMKILNDVSRKIDKNVTDLLLRGPAISSDGIRVLLSDDPEEIAEVITRSALKPHESCISYEQLLDLDKNVRGLYGRAHYEKATMHDVVRRIVRPVCEETGKSYAEYLNPDGLIISAFITHSWNEKFSEVVKYLTTVFQSSLKKPNIWICAFALLQGDYKKIKDQVQGDGNLETSPFVLALKEADFFVVLRNSNTDLYTRIWCVCELLFAMKFGLVPNRTLITGPETFANTETTCLEAESSVVEDKVQILEYLELNYGAEDVDEKIREFRKMKLRTTTGWQLKHLLLFLIGCIAIIAAAGVISVMMLQPTPSIDVDKEIERIITTEFPNLEESLSEEDSPQYNAFDLLVRNSDAEDLGVRKILQQFGLYSMYFKTGGSDWTQKRNWLESNYHCDWYGINCTDGEVLVLDLGNNNLAGEIPGEIRTLTSLLHLNLGKNMLTNVPSDIGAMTSIITLDLSKNDLTSVPSNVGAMTSLITLDLSENDLISVPSNVAKTERCNTKKVKYLIKTSN